MHEDEPKALVATTATTLMLALRLRTTVCSEAECKRDKAGSIPEAQPGLKLSRVGAHDV